VPIIPFYLFGHLAFDPKTYLTMAVVGFAALIPARLWVKLEALPLKRKIICKIICKHNLKNTQTQSEGQNLKKLGSELEAPVQICQACPQLYGSAMQGKPPRLCTAA
jgi:hypothetical protein